MHSGPDRVLALQRRAGNRAVGALLARKVAERNFPGGGQVDDIGEEFVLWNFDVGSETLKPEHVSAIDEIVDRVKPLLAADPEAQVDVEGEASSTGATTANDQLATRRAGSVRAALVRDGLDEARIRQTSTGELKSQPQETQRGMAHSRAVRVVVARPAAAPGLATATGGCNTLIPLDLVGGPVAVREEGPFVLVRAGNPQSPGMTVTATRLIVPRGCAKGADLVFVQDVLPFREIVYRDGSRVTLRTSSWHLDKDDPYPSQDLLGFPTANDSPAMGVPKRKLDEVMTIEVRDHFRMFFVMRRDGRDTTLQVAEWSFVGLAKNDRPGEPGGKLVLDTTVSRVMPAAGSGRHVAEAPVLSPHISELRFVAETGGLSAADALAVPEAEILNRALARERQRRQAAASVERADQAGQGLLAVLGG